jgi:hypothetical protein
MRSVTHQKRLCIGIFAIFWAILVIFGDFEVVLSAEFFHAVFTAFRGDVFDFTLKFFELVRY